MLKGLFDRGAVRVTRSDWFERQPPPLGKAATADRLEGMLLGLAIGDSLGHPEGMVPAHRKAQYGDRRDYLVYYRTGEARGYPTDDTQMSFWTVEHLLEHGRLDPKRLGKHFLQSRIRGIGSTVRQALKALERGIPWEQAAPESAGNGALMRIAPVLLPHLRDPSPRLWSDAVLAGLVTHNDRASHASCVAMVRLLWDLLSLEEAPSSEWWLESWLEPARAIEGEGSYRLRTPSFPDFEGPLWRLVEDQVPRALDAGVQDVDETGWYSGAYLLETVPCMLFLLARYGHDPEEALVRAATDTWDSDTVASLVGAAMGALHGRAALPRRWVDGLAGWVREGDEGTVFRLLDEIRPRFYPDAW